MENKNKFNTVLLVVIVILLVVVIWLVARKTNTPTINNNENVIPQQNNQNISQPAAENPENVWVKSGKLGLFYPPNFKVSEFYFLTPAQTSQGVPESQGVPVFRATDGNATISWGDEHSACSTAEFGVFQPGVSVVACVKGLRAQVGVENVRNALTSEEIKLFGDFVMKNS